LTSGDIFTTDEVRTAYPPDRYPNVRIFDRTIDSTDVIEHLKKVTARPDSPSEGGRRDEPGHHFNAVTHQDFIDLVDESKYLS